MAEKQVGKPVALAVGAALAGSFAVTGTANAETGVSPFSMTTLSAGYLLGLAEGGCGGDKEAKETEGSCGEGKCGGDKEGGATDAEGSCGGDKEAEGSCGGDKEAEAKDAEGSCGGDKEAEGSCGGEFLRWR
jgi:uncharacterized low-complexity protein